MSAGYFLVNNSKNEWISFYHVNASSMRELAGNEASSAMISWYMLNNIGDEISFVSDSHGEWPFKTGHFQNLNTYDDVTEKVIAELIKAGILAKMGFIYDGRTEGDEGFIYDIRNVWECDVN